MWDACFNGSQSTPSGESKFVTTSTKIVDALWIYFGPIILLVGVTGNVLIVFVMTRERMRDTSTSAFMILMAVADLLTLLVGLFVDWLSSLRVSVFGSDPWFPCTAEAFLKYTIGDVATWIKVLFTLNRFVAICFPLKKPIVCSQSSVKYQASAVVAAAVCKNLHVFWTRELLVGVEGRKEKCNDTNEVDRDSGSASFDSSTFISICGYPNPESAYFEMYVRPVIALVTVGILPFCIVLFCNIFIIRAMLKMYRTRRQHDMIHQTSARQQDSQQIYQTAGMCLAASMSLLVCLTPSIIMSLGHAYWADGGSNVTYKNAKIVNNLIYYINFSANFFLYCLSGKGFRDILKETVLRRRSTKRRHCLSELIPPGNRSPKLRWQITNLPGSR